MFDFFFRYFLLFPKILIYEHWGILIGEIILIMYWPYILATRSKLGTNDLVVTYYAFVIYFVFISSLITSIRFGLFPAHSFLYLVRMLLCFGIFVWASTVYKKYGSTKEVVERVYNKPFFIHFILTLVVMACFYVTFKPSANEILWDYKVGLRAVPFAGMVVDFSAFLFLNVVSGSGNLLAGWALAILIINFNLGKGNYKRSIIVVAIVTVLLTISRGGFLTMAIYLLYRNLKGFDGKISLRTASILAVFVGLLAVYITLTATTPLPNVFERLTNTVDSGTLDGSSQGRLDNYIALLQAWVTDIRYVVFGFGFDENALLATSDQTVVESFFLEIIVCSGIVGIVLFAIFYLTAYINHKKNFWFRCLLEFLIFQSIVSWTVTGGDFLAPHATYIIMTLIGFGYAAQRAASSSDLSAIANQPAS